MNLLNFLGWGQKQQSNNLNELQPIIARNEPIILEVISRRRTSTPVESSANKRQRNDDKPSLSQYCDEDDDINRDIDYIENRSNEEERDKNNEDVHNVVRDLSASKAFFPAQGASKDGLNEDNNNHNKSEEVQDEHNTILSSLIQGDLCCFKVDEISGIDKESLRESLKLNIKEYSRLNNRLTLIITEYFLFNFTPSLIDNKKSWPKLLNYLGTKIYTLMHIFYTNYHYFVPSR